MEADKRGPDGWRIEEVCQGEVTNSAASHQHISPAALLLCTVAICNRCLLITNYVYLPSVCVGHTEA